MSASPPRSGHDQHRNQCPTSAKSRHRQRFDRNSSLNPKYRSLPLDRKKLPRSLDVGNFLLICASIRRAIGFALSRWGKKSSRQLKRRCGIRLALFAIGVVVSTLLIASYIRRAEWVAFCSMAMSITVVIGAVFALTKEDPSSARAVLTWLAGQLPIDLDEQIIDDQTATLTGDSVASICEANNRPGCTQARQTGALISSTQAKRAVKRGSGNLASE
jgi:hypothetical protein